MFEPFALIMVGLTFLLAGLTKGVIGMGLPTVSLAGLTIAFDLPTAMALLLAPSLATNVWQAVQGGQLLSLCRRLWLFLLSAALLIWAGVLLSEHVAVNDLSVLLGMALVSYALLGLFGTPPHLQPSQQTFIAPLAGAVNGILTGLTGSFVVPGVLYLQALQLPRAALIQAMGLLFTVSTAVLALALADQQRITVAQFWLSMLAIVPAFAGMWWGRKIRELMSEAQFKRVFFFALLLLGGVITTKALLVSA